MSKRLLSIPPNHVCQKWPLVEQYVVEALKYGAGEYSAEQLKVMLTQGVQALLVALDGDTVVGAATVAFENYPNDRIGFITAIGGKFISTPELWDQLHDWMRGQGCTKIRGAARPAIARLWKQKFGFEQRYIIVEHPL